MQHLPEVLKIIEGGIQNNSTKVVSYAKLLAEKLEKDGEVRSSSSILRRLATKQNGRSNQSLAPQLIDNTGYENLLPIDQDSRLSLADVHYPQEASSHVQLPSEVESDVDEFLQFIDKSFVLSEAGVGISPSMLIYGPSGCGKTRLAHHIASKLGLPIITARCDTLISSFLGSTAKNLRGLFDHAASRPCVFFLDEFDAFAKARDDQHELGELKRVVVSLLQNIDQLPDNTILIAATNHEELLDEAVWRRFAYRLEIPFPDFETRQALLKQFLGNFYSSPVEVLAEVTTGMNGSDIEQFCKSAIRKSIIEEKGEVESDELMVKFLKHRYAHIVSDSSKSDEEKVIELRRTDSKINTIKRLSMMFGMSTGKISKLGG